MTNAPLYRAVEAYSRAGKARFHMPGHGGCGDGLYAGAAYDATELDGLDNLLCPKGAIAEAETLAAQAFGCARSLFLTCGCTIANHIGLRLMAEYGRRVIALGPMHASFASGCMLAGIEPQYCETVEQACDAVADTDVAGICVTSPDYFGRCADLPTLARAAHDAGKLLWVDAAHGAHFGLCDGLPERAERYGDIVGVSMHKTLPVYGGGALLQLSDRVPADRAVYWRNLLHTTSPGYLVMASMDYARAWAQTHGAQAYRDTIARIAQLRLPSPCAVVANDDPTRLVVSTADADARDANAQLQAQGVWAEMACIDRLVCIVTPRNVDRLDALERALARVNWRKADPIATPAPCADSGVRGGAVEFVSPRDAVGRICGAPAGTYPPGVPLIRRGQIYDEDTVRYLTQASDAFGLVHGRLVVLEDKGV